MTCKLLSEVAHTCVAWHMRCGTYPIALAGVHVVAEDRSQYKRMLP